jgi:AcrR family transcriptional regulator
MTEKRRLAADEPRRPRNAAATREAILHSALAAFSRYGYDGVGVRDIARAAGVTGVLVNRYFGSKEELFAATVEVAFADRSLFEGDPTLLAERLAEVVMSKSRMVAKPINPFHMLLRSAPNPRAATILRDSIARHFERPLQTFLPGPKASERAALIIAVMAGFQLLHGVIGSKALSDARRASLAGDLKTVFQLLIDGAARGAPPPVRRSRPEALGRQLPYPRQFRNQP